MAVAAGLVLLAANACGPAASDPPAPQRPPAELPVTLVNGRSTAAPKALALSGSGYALSPLLNVGDRVPLLSGRWDEAVWDPVHTYGVAGKLDGMGLRALSGGYVLWVSHEISEGRGSQFSPDVSGSFSGGRISLFRFDAEWRCQGGRSLICSWSDLNGVYGSCAYTAGSLQQNWLRADAAEGKYCSATLFDSYGQQPLYFPGEETGHGRAKVVYPDGRAVVLVDTPCGSWENVVPLAAFAAQGQTVILLLDDAQRAYLFMYVGQRSATDPWGLLSGTTYVAALQNDSVFMSTSYGLRSGKDASVVWTAVPREFYCGRATTVSERVDLLERSRAWCAEPGMNRATRFIRIEDGEEDAGSPGRFYFTTTGDDKGAVESETNPDMFGHIWRLSLDPAADPASPASLSLLAAGASDSLISPDNLELAGHMLFVQEDVTSGRPSTAMAAQSRSNSVWSLDLQSLSWQRLFSVSQLEGGQPVLPGGAASVWETTGITALPEEYSRGGRPALLLNVQAHGLSDAAVLGGDYVEDGQLLLALPR